MRTIANRSSLLVVALIALVAAFQVANAQGPPPASAGSLLTSAGPSSLGGAIGPDGALYVGNPGTGGDTEYTLPADLGGFSVMLGFTGEINRIDPVTGEVTVAADGIPSIAIDGQGSGITDVAFIGADLYYLMTSLTPPAELADYPFNDYPNGIYKVGADGTSTLVADIGAFNIANDPGFPDGDRGGNPFSFTPYDGGFVVSDGNFNRLLDAKLDGTISILIQFDNIVPTGTAVDADGNIFFTEIGPFPHDPSTGKVFALNDGEATLLGAGLSNVIDVEFGGDGTMYILTLGDQDATGEAPGVPFTGKIATVNADGTFNVVAQGYMFATSLDISGDTAFVSGLAGMVWRIDNLSTVQLPPESTPTPEPTTQPTPVPTTPTPAPTPTPTTVPTQAPGPPDTGTGLESGSGSDAALWLALIGVAIVATGGAVVATARARAS